MTFDLVGAKAIFDDDEDVRLTAAYYRYNRDVFDGSLPFDVKVRWAKLVGPPGYFGINGWLPTSDPRHGQFLFIDERLRSLYPASGYLVDLVLLHEMCHFRAPQHDGAFVAELLTALERVSWEPLVASCVPISLRALFRKEAAE